MEMYITCNVLESASMKSFSMTWILSDYTGIPIKSDHPGMTLLLGSMMMNYFFPSELAGTVDRLQPVHKIQFNEVISLYEVETCCNAGNTYHHEYFEYVCNLRGLSAPNDWREALNLFHYLVTLAE